MTSMPYMNEGCGCSIAAVALKPVMLLKSRLAVKVSALPGCNRLQNRHLRVYPYLMR